MIELLCITQLRPSRRAPHLLPARVRVGASTIPAVRETGPGGVEDLLSHVTVTELCLHLCWCDDYDGLGDCMALLPALRHLGEPTRAMQLDPVLGCPPARR